MITSVHRSEERPVERAAAAEEHQQEDEDRQVEVDEVGIDVLVLLGDQRAGEAAGHGGDDEGDDLVAIDATPTDAGGDLVRLQREKGAAEPALQQVAQKRWVTRQSARPNQTHCSIVNGSPPMLSGLMPNRCPWPRRRRRAIR